MVKTVKVPVLGQSVEEVRILQWFKKEGDQVSVGERLAEIETDKANIEVESPEAGVVHKILAPADTYLPVESPLLLIEAPNGLQDTPDVLAADSTVSVSPRARRQAQRLGIDLTAPTDYAGSGPRGRILTRDILENFTESGDQRPQRTSPLARAVASHEGLDVAGLAGTGHGGRILAQDVRSAAAPPPRDGMQTLMLTGLRKRVADNLARSVRDKPHVTLNASVEMTEAGRLRSQLLGSVEKAIGVRLSPTDLIVKACAMALHEHKRMNAHIEGETITLFDEVHIGLAVSLGDEGLIVPVIRAAHRKGLAQIAQDRQELAARARAGGLTPQELQGATFTITSLGNYGIESFNPIIAPPQVAILGVGAIADTVVAREGAATVRSMMGLSLSFDHRAVDGAPAAAFLGRVREILETPYLLLV